MTAEFKKIGIVGAGLMGHGIAQLMSLAGCQVNLYDANPKVLGSAPERMAKNFEVFTRLGMVEADKATAAVDGVSLSPDMAALCEGRDFIIEAVSENLELKRKIFAELETLAPESCVLASNTSSISIGKIARDLKTPHRVLGTHFWNPPQVVPGVEVIKAPKTTDDVFQAVCDFLAAVGKEPIKVLKDVPGFVGNRMQHALWREAIQLVERGIADAEDVDKVVRYGFGLRMAFLGPLATADLAGLDLTYDIHLDLLPELDCGESPSPLLAQKYKAGQLGAKTGQGFHQWPPEKLGNLLAQRDEVLLKILKVVGGSQGE